MNTETKAKRIAFVATVFISGAVLAFLYLYTISVGASAKQPKEKGEIAMVDEEFIEVIDPVLPVPVANEPAAANLENNVENQSQSAPPSGVDKLDAGQQGVSPKPVTSKEPSPIKVKKDPTPAGPAKTTSDADKKIKKEVEDEVIGALGKGKNNSTNSPNGNGDSGSTKTDGVTTGTAKGSVKGGWQMPSYARLKSNVTGTVKVELAIDKSGNVVSVKFIGGTQPAYTNTSVRNAIEKEMKKPYHHPNKSEAQPTKAYITYTFK